MEQKLLIHLIYHQDDPSSEPRLSYLGFPAKTWSTPVAKDGATSAAATAKTLLDGHEPASALATVAVVPVAFGLGCSQAPPAALEPGGQGVSLTARSSISTDKPEEREPLVADSAPDATDHEIALDDPQPPVDDILAQLAWEGEQALRDVGFRSEQQRRFSCAVPAPGPALAADQFAQPSVEAGETVADMLDGLGTIDQLLAGLDAAGADDFLQPVGEPELLQLFAHDGADS